MCVHVCVKPATGQTPCILATESVNAATERCEHTQVDFLWITRPFRTIAVLPINWERLVASVFTPTLPATKRRSRTCATRATHVIFKRKHCSRKRRNTQVELSSPHKSADNRTNAGTVPESENVRSTCGRL